MIRFAAPLALTALPVLALLILASRVRVRELVLPALASLALLFALSGPELPEARREGTTWVLLDRSPSVRATTTDGEALDAVASLRAANSAAQFGVIAFSSRAEVVSAISLDAASPAGLPGAEALGERTNLEAAIRLALTASSDGGVDQMVLVGDGRITDGLAEGVLAAASARVPISTLPLGREALDDAAVESLEVPANIVVGRPFYVVADVSAPSPGEAVLALFRNGELVASRSVAWTSAGETALRLLDTVTEPGPVSYRAVVRRPGDPVPENDSLSAYSDAGGAAPLLVIATDASASALSPLLTALARPFDVRPSVPSLDELAAYRTALMTGFPLERLRADEIETLSAYVADLGGGLLVAEGENEARGTRGGGAEDLLPVSYTVPQDAERASLAVVYVLDRSGSMEGSAGGMLDDGPLKIDVLRSVTAASIALLAPDAQVGIVAFNWDCEWIRPVALLGGGSGIGDELGTLRASGGTDVYPPIVEALDAIEQTKARVKHILLVSDGRTADEPHDWEGLLARLAAQSDVHLSVIAVGYAPNRPLLARLASAGHGSLYVAADFTALPQISMEATQSLLRSRFVEQETPVSGPLARGDLAAIPPVRGYVVTHPRPTSEVLLFAAGDPLFARWRLGLGWVGVLNTDLAGRWSQTWLSWSRGPMLLGALLDALEPEIWIPHGLRISAAPDETGISVHVEARETSGALVNFLDLEAALVPGGETVPLRQTNVGSYDGVLASPAEGGYALRVVDKTRDRVARTPLSLPYSDEYRQTGVDADTLRAIAAATGGRFLESDARLDARQDSRVVSYRPIHAPLLLVSLSLFLLELGRRKLPLRARRPVQGRS